MLYPAPADTPRSATSRATGSPRSRGSALVLALVTVVMLLMLGAAYLQIARSDRRTARDVDLRTNTSDGSILRYIGGILEGDIPLKAVGGDNEFFDYPYTNHAIPRVVEDRYAPITVPGPVPNIAAGHQPAREPRASSVLRDAANQFVARGGEDDDTWLASIQPDLINLHTYNGQPAYYWPHITDLSGVFVDLGDIAAGNDTTGGGQPMPAQYLSTARGTAAAPLTSADADWASGTAYAVPAIAEGDVIPVDAGRFADADDDGIIDSRWTWAPLPSDGGQAYVMAVRIVDNSALINLNVWDYFISRAGSGDPPRGLFPNDLDLESALASLNLRVDAGSLDPLEITNDRGLGATPPDHDQRLFAWLESHVSADTPADWATIGTSRENNSATMFDDPMDPGSSYQKFSLNGNETELRWRGGLNRTTQDNSAAFPASPLEQLSVFSPTDTLEFFRQIDLEQDFTATPYVTGTTASDIANLFTNEPRRWLTVISGSAEFGRVSLTDASEDDLIELFDVPEADRPQLYERTAGTAAGPFWDNDDDYPAQLAAIVQDYRDPDDRLTRVDAGNNTMYGMEYLPFISEVYVQARYEATAVNPGAGPSGEDQVVWTHQDSEIVVEFVNPWPWTIATPAVELWVDGVNRGSLSAATGIGSEMQGHQLVALVVEDTGGTAFPFPADGPKFQKEPVPAAALGWPAPNGTAAQVVELELRAPVTGGPSVVYQRFGAVSPPANRVELATPPTPVALNDLGYMLWTQRGTGDGLAALTVRRGPTNDPISDAGRVDATAATDPPTPGPAMPNVGTEVFIGVHEKGTGFDIDLDNSTGSQPIPRVADAYGEADFPGRPAGGAGAAGAGIAGNEPFQIANTDRVYRAAEIMRMAFLGPREEGGADLTVAEVWDRFPKDANGSFLVSSLMLQPRKADDTLDEPTVGLLASVTAFEEELGLIPGRLNLNTAPQWLIEAALPLANPAARAAVAADLVAERDQVPGPGVSPGIEYLGEMMSNTYTAIYNPTNPAPSRDQVVDFNEPEESLGPDTAGFAHGADGFNLDAEERLALFSFINQMAHTRSDVFTAYVKVRAYPANDFSANGDNDGDGVFDPTRSYRLIAVFDRSGGKWRIRAVKRIEQ